MPFSFPGSTPAQNTTTTSDKPLFSVQQNTTFTVNDNKGFDEERTEQPTVSLFPTIGEKQSQVNAPNPFMQGLKTQNLSDVISSHKQVNIFNASSIPPIGTFPQTSFPAGPSAPPKPLFDTFSTQPAPQGGENTFISSKPSDGLFSNMKPEGKSLFGSSQTFPNPSQPGGLFANLQSGHPFQQKK